MGMKREAVQEERQRTRERDTSEVESTSNMQSEMPIERILEAEKRTDGTDDQHQIEVKITNTAFDFLINHILSFS